MSELPDKAVEAAAKFLTSRDQRSLRVLVLAIVVLGGAWVLYACGRFEPFLPAPFARADDLNHVREKLDDHGRQLDSILRFQIASELRASYAILCERISPNIRDSEQRRIEDLQAQYRDVNKGQNYQPPPCP